MRHLALAPALTLAWSSHALAGEADVVAVEVTRQESGRFEFSVAVRHADAGWEHYADKWDVAAPDGTVLGTRVLVHPHDNEQPFTRSLSGVRMIKCMAMVASRSACHCPRTTVSLSVRPERS